MKKNRIKEYNTIILGGGAAGFFTAIQIAEKNPDLKILILEKSPKVLEKVKISGGGRCNVTHACFEPKELVQFYPRGHQELLGPFHTFMCGDMMSWLEKNGVKTKIESDGRVFPVSNDSQTIIDCFLRLCKKYQIEIRTKLGVDDFKFKENRWLVKANSYSFSSEKLVIATGSNRKLWSMLSDKGHEIAKPVPSLFTFKIKHALIQDLPGISIPMCGTKIKGQNREEVGPVLITHKGLSGPGILKISAWEAVHLAKVNYKFTLIVNWLNKDYKSLLAHYKSIRENNSKTKFVSLNNDYNLPKRFWKNVMKICNLENRNFAEAGNKHLESLAKTLTACELLVDGKNTNKDEFVTCGGVNLNEVNFKTMESKNLPNLFFAGEIINVDAVTGGFNFQNAWTTAFIAAKAIGV